MSGKLSETDSTTCLPKVEHRPVSVVIGLKSKTHVVLASVYLDNTELESQEKKIFEVDDHVGAAIPGLTRDGVIVSRYMHALCFDSNHAFDFRLPVEQLVIQVAEKAQLCRKRIGSRHFGVGLLVGGWDESGGHIYFICNEGNYSEYQAFAIGPMSKEANKYLERVENLMETSRENLVKDALSVLRETLQGGKLRSSVCTVAVVGVDEPFNILSKDVVQAMINEFEIAGEDASVEQQGSGSGAGAADQGA